MRANIWAMLTALSFVCGIVGCGGSDGDANSSNQPASVSQVEQSASASNDSAPNDPIARVAHDFLDAVRQGNIEVANSVLTPLALERTTALNMAVAPPGSPTASFQIGAVDKIADDKAIVESVWTDVDPDGNRQEEAIIWALRLVEDGWRISGMAAEVGPDQEVVIDFENPGGAFAQQDPAENAAGAPPTVQTAKNPFDQETTRQ